MTDLILQAAVNRRSHAVQWFDGGIDGYQTAT
jgi:hypothetical protein